MTKLNQSIQRAMSLLTILAKESPIGLTSLSRRSGLHKSTVHRVLQTLLAEGWVYRRQGDGLFQVSVDMPLLKQTMTPQQHVAERVSKTLKLLQQQTDDWPLVVSMLDGVRMQVVETSGSSQRLKLYDDVMEFRPHILWSAMGRAYLSFCPEQERQNIFKQLQLSKDKYDQITHNQHLIDRIISETKQRGYGTRDPRYTERMMNYDYQLSAIAVPVLAPDRVLATITLMWIAGEATEQQMVKNYLEPIKEASKCISDRLLTYE